MAIETRGLSKHYGDVRAIDGVSIALETGKITAILGENGAGKSTLLKLIAGLEHATTGTLSFDGSKVASLSPAVARRLGVFVVHQHFSLVPSFTGLQNLMLGDEPTAALGVLRPAQMRARAEAAMQRAGLHVALDRPVAALSLGERQRIEILRVLVRGATTLLFDEPTATQTRDEANRLYAMMKQLAQEGATIAVVTHHLDEVVSHADRVIVLRAGEKVFEGDVSGRSIDDLARLALGEVPSAPTRTRLAEDAADVLTLDAVSGSTLRCVSLRVRAGEVVGMAGVEGNGQDELVEIVAGLASPTSGAVLLSGRDVTTTTLAARRALGLGIVLADRHRFGVVVGASVHDNLVLGELGGDEAARSARRLEASGASPAREDLSISSLSGGNQQKIVIARVLGRPLVALVAAQPTRGIDAAAAADVREKIAQAAAAGCAVLLISSDLAELRQLSHRLVVLSRGAIGPDLAPDVAEEVLGRAMLGASAA